MIDTMNRLATAVHRRLFPGPGDFTCIICAHRNRGVPLPQVRNREFQSCAKCRSSLRMRAIVRLLSVELFGKAMPLPAFPVNRSIRGVGMSDWEGIARPLAEKLAYVNTFYHAEPRMDIANIDEDMAGRHRFLISGDVFEHIPLFALERAFRNSRRLLEPGGVFILTVPFVREGETREHFPRLHDFRIEEADGRRRLVNRTVEGEEEVFENLVFHGGEGSTLEMRMFSERDLLRRLKDAGFSSVEVRIDHDPGFGVDWPIDFAVPIVARA